MLNFELIKQVWIDVYDVDLDTETTICKYFHPDFEQCINGEPLNLSGYIEHVINQKKNFILEGINYDKHLENGNELFLVYYPHGKDLSHNLIEAEIFLWVQFLEKKVYRMHGSVRLLSGDAKIIDMGHNRS